MKHLHIVSGLITAALIATGCTSPSTKDQPSAPVKSVQPAQAAQAAPDNDWRMGDTVVAHLGGVRGKVVADLFAGDGYYTWKLMAAGARVIAIDDNPKNIAILEARKKKDGIGDDRLIIRQTQPGNPGLLPHEADLALITREYSTLGDRATWFKELQTGLRPPQVFFLVNFAPGDAAFGPPLSQRMSFNTVADELNTFGYTDVGIEYKTLPHRYILFADIPPVTP